MGTSGAMNGWMLWPASCFGILGLWAGIKRYGRLLVEFGIWGAGYDTNLCLWASILSILLGNYRGANIEIDHHDCKVWQCYSALHLTSWPCQGTPFCALATCMTDCGESRASCASFYQFTLKHKCPPMEALGLCSLPTNHYRTS